MKMRHLNSITCHSNCQFTMSQLMGDARLLGVWIDAINPEKAFLSFMQFNPQGELLLYAYARKRLSFLNVVEWRAEQGQIFLRHEPHLPWVETYCYEIEHNGLLLYNSISCRLWLRSKKPLALMLA